MTDDSDDDRMDRAERIRQMRAGGTDESSEDEAEEPMAETQSDTDATEPAVTDSMTAETTEVGDGGTGADADQDVTEDDGAEEAGDEPAETQGEPAGSSESGDEEVTEEEPAGDGDEGDEEVTEEAEEDRRETKLLEFELGGERYAIDVTDVDEIVEEHDVARIPNTPDCVDGLIDLRGRVTAVLDPTEVLEPPGEPAAEQLIVVFDPEGLDDHSHVGWLVDDVEQVFTITEAEISQPPADYDWMKGVVEMDDRDEYIVWISPDLVFDRTREVIQGDVVGESVKGEPEQAPEV